MSAFGGKADILRRGAADCGQHRQAVPELL